MTKVSRNCFFIVCLLSLLLKMLELLKTHLEVSAFCFSFFFFFFKLVQYKLEFV